MERESRKTMIIATVLLIIYTIILAWSILFKMAFPIAIGIRDRSVNLIPFYYSSYIGTFKTWDIEINILAFIPFGIYLSMLFPKLKIWKKVFIVMGLSVVFEALQYILSVGATDITDVISNTSGGIIGIGLYLITLKLIKNKQRLDFVITVLASLATIVLIIWIGIVSAIYS